MNWFLRPYPLLQSFKSKLLVIIGFGLFIPTFLYIYQPIGISEISDEYRFQYVIGIGLNISFVLALNYFIVPMLFQKVFNPEKWVIWKEILYILSTFFYVTCANYIYNNTVGQDISPPRDFVQFIGITIAVGFFPVMFMVFLMERNLYTKNSQKANEYRKLLPRKNKKSKKIITIVSESSKSDDLVIDLNDFIFATSDNNYSTIYYESNESIQKVLLRLSFKNLEEQVSGYDSIIRCHKSYIVNRNRILNIKGNARSLSLEMDLHQNLIPVSRSFPKEKLI